MERKEVRARSVGRGGLLTAGKERAFDVVVERAVVYFNQLAAEGAIENVSFIDMTAADGVARDKNNERFKGLSWRQSVSPGILAHHALALEAPAQVVLYERREGNRRELRRKLADQLGLLCNGGRRWTCDDGEDNEWSAGDAHLMVPENGNSSRRHRFGRRPGVLVIHDPNTVCDFACNADVLDSFDRVDPEHLITVHWMGWRGFKRGMVNMGDPEEILGNVSRLIELTEREVLVLYPTKMNPHEFAMFITGPKNFLKEVRDQMVKAFDEQFGVESYSRTEDEAGYIGLLVGFFFTAKELS